MAEGRRARPRHRGASWNPSPGGARPARATGSDARGGRAHEGLPWETGTRHRGGVSAAEWTRRPRC
eukprot:5417951-Pyramimonas_sp.AAC.1